MMSISCDSFLDCLPRGVRILRRRILMQIAVACVCWLKENCMSRKNGDHARFDRQRKAKIHNRTRIRELRKTIRAQESTSAQNADRRGKKLGSPESTKKSTIKSTDSGA